jgi:hypothetical protein
MFPTKNNIELRIGIRQSHFWMLDPAEAALELAPESGLAHELLAVALVRQVFMRSDRSAISAAESKRSGRESGGNGRIGGICVLGALRRAGIAQLIEAASGNHIWAETYDRLALGMVQFTMREPDKAIATLEQGLQINLHASTVFVREEDKALFVEGLRTAGLAVA